MGRGAWGKKITNGKTFLHVTAGSGCRAQIPYKMLAKAVWMPLILTGWRNVSLSVLPARKFQPHYDKTFQNILHTEKHGSPCWEESEVLLPPAQSLCSLRGFLGWAG